jgi:hypothetical protein
MSNEKYNGWTNYATWRVNLEMFDNFDPEEQFTTFDPEDVAGIADGLQSYAEDLILYDAQVPMGLAHDYALAFLNNVNWYEIANHIVINYLADVLTEEGI